MKRSRVFHGILAIALSCLLGLVAACSKDDNKPATAPVAESFESGDLSNSGPTSTFVRRFNTAGSFSYRCRFHGGMTGVVSVAGADSVVVPISDFAFGPPTVESFPVKTGGYVRWINGGTTHSVTRP